MMFQFNKYYFLYFILLLAIEYSLLFTKGFIRHTFGDFLVVILIYCFVMSFLKSNYKRVAFGVLILSYTIELIQLTNLLQYLHLEELKAAKIVLGNTFSILDLVAYTFGILTILLIERKLIKNTVS